MKFRQILFRCEITGYQEGLERCRAAKVLERHRFPYAGNRFWSKTKNEKVIFDSSGGASTKDLMISSHKV